MLYCDKKTLNNLNKKFCIKKSRNSTRTATATKNELERGYSAETKPWEIRSARNAAGLSVLTR